MLFLKEWLSNKYNKLILKTLHDIDDSIKDLEFIIKPQTIKNTLLKIEDNSTKEQPMKIFN